jgi:hypothetical protein
MSPQPDFWKANWQDILGTIPALTKDFQQVPGRAWFPFDIADEVMAAIGVNRLGGRFSHFGQYGGIHEGNPMVLFSSVIRELSKLRTADLHLIEARGSEMGLTDQLHEKGRKQCGAVPPHFRRTTALGSRLHAEKCGRCNRQGTRGCDRVRPPIYR